MSTPERKIVLKASDGLTFKLTEAVINQSEMIRQKMEDDCADNCILLPRINSNVLSKVIRWCGRHYHTPDSRELIAFDADFLNVNKITLIRLISAAARLRIKNLNKLLMQNLRDLVDGKNSEELSRIFNLAKST